MSAWTGQLFGGRTCAVSVGVHQNKPIPFHIYSTKPCSNPDNVCERVYTRERCNEWRYQANVKHWR